MLSKQQRLYRLLQDHDLHLTVADFIQAAYHQWENDYLTALKCAEHISNSMSKEENANERDIYTMLTHALSLGRRLAHDKAGK